MKNLEFAHNLLLKKGFNYLDNKAGIHHYSMNHSHSIHKGVLKVCNGLRDLLGIYFKIDSDDELLYLMISENNDFVEQSNMPEC